MKMLARMSIAALPVFLGILATVTGLPGPMLKYTTVRETFPNDVEGLWQLVEEAGSQSVCPTSIEHTTYTSLDEPFLILPHNTIEQDGERCNSVGDEKRLEVYESDKYDADLMPIDPASAPLPPALKKALSRYGRVINVYNALKRADERYMMGFERKVRVCNKISTIFKANTTLFFARPFDSVISIKNLETKLSSGYKYMLMIPPNQDVTCVYTVNIDASPGVEPIPSASDDEKVPTVDPSPPVFTTGPPLSSTAPTGPNPSPTPSDDSNSTPEAPDLDGSVEPTDPVQGGSGNGDSASPTGEGDDVCFPAEARVTLENGQDIRIDALKPGQYVSVGAGKFSRVYGFSHDDAHALSQFVVLSTESGHTLCATSGHFVYVNGLPTTMSHAVVGDDLTLYDGKTSKIVSTEVKLMQGLYNPQTADGNIVVDGVLATTFTTAVQPAFANAALLPLRVLQRLLGGDWVSPFTGASARRLLVWLPSAISA